MSTAIKIWMVGSAFIFAVASVDPTEAITLEMVAVGDAGNPANATGYGAVSYNFQIGKYDVTAAQYTAFLNAVASTDTYGLYSSVMATAPAACGILQSGSAGNYTYSATRNGSFPVNNVSWGDAARFCNWLQNGQPTGAEGNGTTETGAYTLSGGTSDAALMLVTRNTGATYFIPSEDEWYKAAYYKGGGTNAGYWSYPTQSNTPPINTLPDTGNHANFFDNFGTGNGSYTNTTSYLTPVGTFTLSPGPYGTYDQAGDVWQWNEGIISASYRGERGASFSDDSSYFASSYRYFNHPSLESTLLGFRVASSVAVPEPGSSALMLSSAVAGLIWRRRRK
jgi:formylglycine-generating enzyme required for sulfatase activity